MADMEAMNEEPTIVHACLLIDTIESYMQSKYARVETKKNGSKCVFCNKTTAFDNRHVCPSCFELYRDDILCALKQGTADVEIKIIG